MLRATVKLDLSRMNAYEHKIERGLDPTTRDIANSILSDIRASWSPESPSVPGEPPAVVTGRLDRSGQVEKTGRSSTGRFASHGSATAYIIRFRAPYGAILEDYMNRPFFEPALERASFVYDIAYRRLFS